MPAGKGCGLTAALSIQIPKGPDTGIVDHKAVPLAVDADAAIALVGILLAGIAQGLGPFAAFLLGCGEPRGHAHHLRPAPLPQLEGGSIGIHECRVAAVVMG